MSITQKTFVSIFSFQYAFFKLLNLHRLSLTDHVARWCSILMGSDIQVIPYLIYCGEICLRLICN